MSSAIILIGFSLAVSFSAWPVVNNLPLIRSFARVALAVDRSNGLSDENVIWTGGFLNSPLTERKLTVHHSVTNQGVLSASVHSKSATVT